MALDLRLSPGPRAPAEARRSLGARLGRVDAELLEKLRLLVSELVSNSVRHAALEEDDHIRLSVWERGDRVRVEVTDPGDGFTPPVPDPDPLNPSGWGLYLVDRLADRWGVATNGETRVWFEVAC
jgi:anti-sigma regulatory factor (Ser/Thr protein kinase)